MGEPRSVMGPEDGRRKRSRESRLRIVEAVRALVRAGDVAPSAEDVATRADVGLRTVFRHFEDMDSLYREVSAATFAEVAPLLLTPVPEGPLEERLRATVEQRAAVFEAIMPFKIAGEVQRHRSEFLRRDHEALVHVQRERLRAVLPANVRADRTTFDLLDLVFSIEAWRRLRHDQGLSVAAAKRTVLAGALALLGLTPR